MTLFLAVPLVSVWLGELTLEIAYLGFEHEHAADTGQSHPFTCELRRFFNGADLVLAVATLAARRSGRLHHLFAVQASQRTPVAR